MHELSLLEQLRDLAVEQALAHGGGRIVAITLRVGRLAGGVAGALHFAHAVVMEGSLAEGSTLRIEPVAASWFCQVCALEFSGAGGDPTCPSCGTISRQLRHGRELELISLELEVPEQAVSEMAVPDIESLDSAADSFRDP